MRSDATADDGRRSALMNTKQRVSAPRGRASCRFGCQRVGCDRISLPRNPQGRKIATNNFGVREMSVKLCGPHRIPQSNRAARRAGLYGRRWLANQHRLFVVKAQTVAQLQVPDQTILFDVVALDHLWLRPQFVSMP